MKLFSTVAECRNDVMQARCRGGSVGVVPTMGALHDGHLSLVHASKELCEQTVVTIFVNPTQFSQGEDFERYPRTFDRDRQMLEEAGVDAVFAPSHEEMYPAGFSTFVAPPRVAEPLEGVCRPGHFRGVCTVVAKLFTAVPASHALFGYKDYQQLKVIEAMLADLNFGIQIVPCETVREADGLALSSRNRFLDDDQRSRATVLHATLAATRQSVREGVTDAAFLIKRMRAQLMGADNESDQIGNSADRTDPRHGVDHLDYAVIVDAETLQPLTRIDRPAVALVAAFVGSTRLIDNMTL